MFKNAVIALATVAALAGVAAPAIAAPATSLVQTSTSDYYDFGSIAARLQAKGLDVTQVEAFNAGTIRAFVNVDGKNVQQFFDADTLAPVSANGAASTEVGTRLSVGNGAEARANVFADNSSLASNSDK